MNFNCICFILLLGVNYSHGRNILLTTDNLDSNEKNAVDAVFDFVKKLFEEKCNAGYNVSDVLSATKTCLKQYFPINIHDLKNNRNLNALSKICSDLKELLKATTCFNAFNKILQECTVPAEEYLKSFFLKGVGKVLDKICNGTTGAGGIPLYEVLYTPEAIECFESMFFNFNTACNQAQIFNSHTTLTRSRLCGDLSETNNCYLNYVSQQCPAAHNLKKLFRDTLQSMKSPCLDEIPLKPKVIVTPRPVTVRARYSPSYSFPTYHPEPVSNVLTQPGTVMTVLGAAGMTLLQGLARVPLLIG